MVLGWVSAAFGITNGVPAHDLPEVVAVLRGGTCTGALIHPRIVLTDAHCFDDGDLAVDPTGSAAVGVGANVDALDTVVAVERVELHPDYACLGPCENAPSTTGPMAEHDVALLWLVEPLSGPVVALNEAPLGPEWVGISLEIAGYGITEWLGSGGGVRRRGATRIDALDAEVVHLFDPDGSSTCPIDAGGPAIRFQGDLAVQVSVSHDHGECGASPARQMRVDANLPWIREAIAPEEVTTVALVPPRVICDEALPVGAAVERTCTLTVPATDPLLDVTWDWGDGVAQSGPDTERAHTYDAPGTHDASVCVTTEHRGRPIETCIDAFASTTVPDPADDTGSPDGQGCGCRQPGGPASLGLLALALPLLRRRGGYAPGGGRGPNASAMRSS